MSLYVYYTQNMYFLEIYTSKSYPHPDVGLDFGGVGKEINAALAHTAIIFCWLN